MIKMKLPPSTDYQTLDFLRFLSAYGVVIYHYQQEFNSVVLSLFFKSLTSYFNLFVDLFFVISGFIISFVYCGKIKSFNSYFSFLKKRFARLWPLHVIILLCYVLIWFAASYFNYPPRNPAKYNFDCLVPHLLMLHALNTCDGVAFNYVSWSISAELFMYFLAPILFVVADVGALFVLLFSVVSTVVLFLHDGHDYYMHWTTSWGVLRAFPAFAFGVFVYKVRGRLIGLPFPLVIFFSLLISFFLLPFVFSGSSEYFVLLLVYMIVVSAVAVDVNKKSNILINKVAPFGQLTYSLYMLHPLVQTVVFSFFASKVFGFSGWLGDLTVFALLPILFVLSCVSFVYVETPLRRIISQSKIGFLNVFKNA